MRNKGTVLKTMNMAEIEQARHAGERGAILRTLAEDYSRAMTLVSTLAGALDLQGISVSHDGLVFSLILLADSGYIQIWRARDLPTWRPDRRRGDGDAVVAAKLLPKGLGLIDGLIPADPQVHF